MDEDLDERITQLHREAADQGIELELELGRPLLVGRIRDRGRRPVVIEEEDLEELVYALEEYVYRE